MPEIIHVIQQRAQDDCGLAWPDFPPEAYRDEKQAIARLETLKASLGQWTGLYYELLQVELK